MTTRATGTFEVSLTPQPHDDTVGDAQVGRMAIEKKFHGALEAVSRGEMLAHRTSTPTSAGYVAIERVVGTLDGKRGSFVLMHTGEMNRGAQSLTITVVPDSGTEGLVGLRGTMRIIIAGGAHSYELDYELAPGA